MMAFAFLATVFLCATLVVVLLYEAPTSRARKWFCLFLGGLLLWVGTLYFYFLRDVGSLLAFVGRLNFAAGPLVALGLLGFFYVFPRVHRPFPIWSLWSWVGISAVMMGITCFTSWVDQAERMTPQGPVFTPGWAYGIYTMYLLIAVGILFFLVFSKLRAFTGIEKQKVQYAFWMFPISSLVLVITNVILPGQEIFIFQDYSFLLLVPTIFCVVYALEKYRFLDMPLAFQTYAVYLTNLGIYAGISHLMWYLNAGWFHQENVFVGLFIALFVLTGWSHTLGAVQSAWNIFLYKKKTNVLDEIRLGLRFFQSSVDQGLDYLSSTLGVETASWVAVGSAEGQDLAQCFQAQKIETLVRDEIVYKREHSGEIWPRRKNSRRYQRWLQEAEETLEKYRVAVVVPILREDGTPVGFVFLKEKLDGGLFSSQEIREVERLLQERAQVYLLRDSEERSFLRKLKKGVGTEFFNDFCHEMEHPLMVVRNLEHLVNVGKLPQADQEAFSMAYGAARDLKHKLSELTEIFQWQHEQKSLACDWYSLEPLMHSTLQQLFSEFPHWKEVVTLCMEPSLFVYEMHVDKNRLRSVFRELIRNGLFFNQSAAKKVNLRVRFDKNSGIYFQVQDNGVGIEAEHHDDIFKPLKVFSPSRNEKECGLGVGLPLAREIVEAHGGELFIKKSALKEGSIFVFHFPLGRIRFKEI